ncbi:hypothetical protein F4778DRAFT_130125 [Xylariomycetidae sp. FL2044]|nr:hypothetical protein F4778DRAFT_130125 [Xylariomycetidae sp. FL2044]
MVGSVDFVDSFLQNGYWPNSRARNAESRNSGLPTAPSSPSSVYIDSRTPRQLPFIVNAAPFGGKHPPPPSVEDETESLAKELGSVVSTEEPPHRGTPNQEPIFLLVHEHNPERRFVLVSTPPDSSDEQSNKEKKPRRRPKSHERRSEPEPPTTYEANTGRSRKQESQTPRKDESLKPREARPNRERRRSRPADLPAIVTNVNVDDESKRRDFRRAKSTTRVESRGDDYFSPRNSRFRDESSLTPDFIEHGTSGRDKQYYNGGMSPRTPGRNRSAHPQDQYARTEASDRNYTGTSPKTAQSISPTYPKRTNTADLPKLVRRSSKEYSRQPPDIPRPNLERKGSSPPYAQPDREPAAQRSSRDQRESRRYDDSFYSDDEEPRGVRFDNRRRRKSGLPPGKDEYLTTPIESRPSEKRRSRGPSPLPSPRVSQNFDLERAPLSPRPSSTFPRETRTSREEERLERPISRASTAKAVLGAAVPLAIPTVLAAAAAASTKVNGSTDFVRSSVPPPSKAASLRSEARSTPSTPSPSSWQPPRFDPSPKSSNSSFSEKMPVRPYRRYSQELQGGDLPNIPDCPRTRAAAGQMGWFTLPRSDSFNMCPSCYESSFAETEFGDSFRVAPIRGSDRAIACDFGKSQYYQIAWLFTRKYRRPDLGLFHSLANLASKVQPCTGSREASRIWYSIKDPQTQRPIQGFTVCQCCAQAIQLLLPVLTGVFVPMDSPAEPKRGVCAMRPYDADVRMFVLYFDIMEAASDEAMLKQRAPDIQTLAGKISDLAEAPACAGGRPLHNKKWYTMASIPEFTVCRDCYFDVVKPQLERAAASARGPGLQKQKQLSMVDTPVESDFRARPRRLPVAACQLYSARMREVFRKAARRQDLDYFGVRVGERLDKEQEYHDALYSLDRQQQGLGGSGGGEWKVAEAERLTREWRRWE